MKNTRKIIFVCIILCLISISTSVFNVIKVKKLEDKNAELIEIMYQNTQYDALQQNQIEKLADSILEVIELIK